MRIRAGAESEFERAWVRGATDVAGLPGNIRQELLRDAEHPSRYMVTSDWEDAAALEVFSGSPQRVEFSAVLETFRETATRDVFELVQRLESSP